MSNAKVQLVRYLYDNCVAFIKCFGTRQPSAKDGTNSVLMRLCFPGKKKITIDLCAIALNKERTDKLVTRHKAHELARTTQCCQIISYCLFNSQHRPVKPPGLIWKCATELIQCFTQATEHRTGLMKLYAMCLNGNRSQKGCCLNARKTHFDKEITRLKKTMCEQNCRYITDRRMANQDLAVASAPARKPKIPVNLVRNTALAELTIFAGCQLSINYRSKLFAEHVEALTFERGDEALVQQINALLEKQQASVSVKLVDINQAGCTCLSKCTGYGRSTEEQRAIHGKAGSLALDNTVAVCTQCMLSPMARNTTAKKPRPSIQATNVELRGCSLHSGDTYRYVSLYRATVASSGYFFRHSFYATNTVNYCAEQSNLNKSGPTNHYCGMCVGKRQCLNLIHGTGNSVRKQRDGDCERYSDIWSFRCLSCRDADCDSFNAKRENTCLPLMTNAMNAAYKSGELGYEEAAEACVQSACVGCCLFLLCQHRDAELFARAEAHRDAELVARAKARENKTAFVPTSAITSSVLSQMARLHALRKYSYRVKPEVFR